MITKKQAAQIAVEVYADNGGPVTDVLARFVDALDKAGAFDETPSRPHAPVPLSHDTADLIDVLMQAGATRTSRDALDVIAAFRAAGVIWPRQTWTRGQLDALIEDTYKSHDDTSDFADRILDALIAAGVIEVAP